MVKRTSSRSESLLLIAQRSSGPANPQYIKCCSRIPHVCAENQVRTDERTVVVYAQLPADLRTRHPFHMYEEIKSQPEAVARSLLQAEVTGEEAARTVRDARRVRSEEHTSE